jgi:acyl carrier protein
MTPDTRVRLERLVEPTIRSAVANHLGVEPQALTHDASLTDDLAGTHDVRGLAVELGASLGFAVPHRTVDEVRTYGDLVAAIATLLEPPGALPFFWARVDAPRRGARAIARSGWLTPYASEVLVEDVLRIGPGARIEITVPTDAFDTSLAWVSARLSCLIRRGVEVRVSPARRPWSLFPTGHDRGTSVRPQPSFRG